MYSERPASLTLGKRHTFWKGKKREGRRGGQPAGRPRPRRSLIGQPSKPGHQLQEVQSQGNPRPRAIAIALDAGDAGGRAVGRWASTEPSARYYCYYYRCIARPAPVNCSRHASSTPASCGVLARFTAARSRRVPASCTSSTYYGGQGMSARWLVLRTMYVQRYTQQQQLSFQQPRSDDPEPETAALLRMYIHLLAWARGASTPLWIAVPLLPRLQNLALSRPGHVVDARECRIPAVPFSSPSPPMALGAASRRRAGCHGQPAAFLIEIARPRHPPNSCRCLGWLPSACRALAMPATVSDGCSLEAADDEGEAGHIAASSHLRGAPDHSDWAAATPQHNGSARMLSSCLRRSRRRRDPPACGRAYQPSDVVIARGPGPDTPRLFVRGNVPSSHQPFLLRARAAIDLPAP